MQSSDRPSFPPSGNNVPDQLRALLPAVAVGATDPDEEEFVARSLPAYPELVRELDGYNRLAEMLLVTSKPTKAPARIETELRLALASNRPLSTAIAQDGLDLNWGPPHAGQSGARPPAPTPVKAPPRPPQAKPRGRQFHFNWPVIALSAAGAVAALLLITLAAASFLEMRRIQSDYVALQERFDGLSSEMEILADRFEDLATQSDQQQAALFQVAESYGRRFGLPAATEGDTAAGAVYWMADSQLALLRADNFPPLPAGQHYQLWMTRQGEQASGGTFSVSDLGTGLLLFVPPIPLEECEEMQITVEPAGGSASPTTPPIVINRWER